MTLIKMCGLFREADIYAVNRIKPDFIGFVFAPRSRRYVTPEKAAALKKLLDPGIKAVGVFTDFPLSGIESLVSSGVIDIVQLHGTESETMVRSVKNICRCPVIKAFKIQTAKDAADAENSCADYILLDSGNGSGKVFDWELLKDIKRPYFLAGGLNPENVGEAIKLLHPYGVDVSTGLETFGLKDEKKMAAFKAAVGKEEQ
jgi:phosphoribosylanthranilate isomerase